MYSDFVRRRRFHSFTAVVVLAITSMVVPNAPCGNPDDASAPTRTAEVGVVQKLQRWDGYSKDIATISVKASEIEQLRDLSGTNANAAFVLGRLYRRGYHVEKNDAAAAQLFRKASELGSVPGKHSYGYMLINGLGVDQDPEVGLKLIREAAGDNYSKSLGHLGHCYHTGTLLPRDIGQAIELYRKAAAKNDRMSLNNLAILMDEGHTGPVSPYATTPLFQKSAKLGYVRAQVNLARRYMAGYGVQKDLYLAYYWARTAADTGDAKAKYLLSTIQLHRQDDFETKYEDLRELYRERHFRP